MASRKDSIRKQARRDLGTVALNMILRPDETTNALLCTMSEDIQREYECEFVLGRKYLAHVSVLQTTYWVRNRTTVEQRVRQITTQHAPLTLKTEEIKPLIDIPGSPWRTFLFWDLQRSSAMTALQQALLSALGPLRSTELLPVHRQLLADRDIPQAMANSLRHHGTLLAGPTERPHFTITRLKNAEDVDPALELVRKLLPSIPLRLTFRKLYLANAGPHGVVNEIFDEFSLAE